MARSVSKFTVSEAGAVARAQQEPSPACVPTSGGGGATNYNEMVRHSMTDKR